ncbi:hypothetical protein N7512_007579 [Penicillium capsulatum]|nr:hypothetical protein N7512_007579 [Penicillium capsulatum]
MMGVPLIDAQCSKKDGQKSRGALLAVAFVIRVTPARMNVMLVMVFITFGWWNNWLDRNEYGNPEEYHHEVYHGSPFKMPAGSDSLGTMHYRWEQRSAAEKMIR